MAGERETASQYAILVIDDEIMVRKALGEIIERHGYAVRLAEDGETALAMAEEEPPDLILCDYSMPGLSGIDVCRKMAEINPDVIRILITGFADVEVAEAAINEGGVYKFVRKPWNTQDLMVMIQRALEHYELVREGRVLLDMLEMANQQQHVQLQGLQDQVARYRKMLGMEDDGPRTIDGR